jgi:dCMP deaminase
MAQPDQWLQWCIAGAQIFSTCGKRQYMAIILDQYGYVVSTGYNGVPSGMTHCKDGGCPRLKNNTPSGATYDDCYSLHAEENALIRADPARLQDAELYVNGPPCFGCAKKIIGSGISRIYCLEDKSYADWPRVHDFLKQAFIQVVFGG